MNCGPQNENETGVQVLVETPSPKTNANKSLNLTCEKSYNKVERPKSPQISHYNQLIFTELAKLKPPEDPDDKVDLDKSSCSKQLQKQEIGKIANHLSAKKPISPYSSFVNNIELDTTDSFILAEQTIVDKNQTLTESPEVKDIKLYKSDSIPAMHLETVVEEEFGSDSEDELLQQTLSKLNAMMVEIENTKKLVNSIVKKKIKRKLNLDNKENVEVSTKKPIKNEWLSELKSENPGLLKTPKPLNNQRMNLAEQTTIWTPHSLSTVLCDQMDNLFE